MELKTKTDESKDVREGFPPGLKLKWTTSAVMKEIAQSSPAAGAAARAEESLQGQGQSFMLIPKWLARPFIRKGKCLLKWENSVVILQPLGKGSFGVELRR